MAYLSEDQLRSIGFKTLGANVKISESATIYNADQISIGDHSRIDDFCVISGLVTIGTKVHVTPQCLLAGGIPGIELEDYSTLAYGVKVFTQSDDYSGQTLTNSLIPRKYKNEIFKKVNIGKFSILGAGSTVMPGATIGEGVAVGAMSLVIKPLEAWGIYAGAPAKFLKPRSKQMLSVYAEYAKEIRDDSI